MPRPTPPPHPAPQDLEAKESDLWGSRGVALAGLSMLYMALMNFRGTVVRGAARAGAAPRGRAACPAYRGVAGRSGGLCLCLSPVRHAHWPAAERTHAMAGRACAAPWA